MDYCYDVLSMMMMHSETVIVCLMKVILKMAELICFVNGLAMELIVMILVAKLYYLNLSVLR